MTPERALEHDERCEREDPVDWDSCRCAERALTAARQREEEAKGEIARLKTQVPCQAHASRVPPATCCYSGDIIAFWDEKFCDAVNEGEKTIDALRAENARLTARYDVLKEDADADAEKLSQALLDAGDAIAERNRGRNALRESQEENARLTLAASESARTLQVENTKLQALINEKLPLYVIEIAALKAQVTALREALIEIRRLQVKNWSDNPDWRNGAEHTWSGQMDIVAEKALAFFQDGA